MTSASEKVEGRGFCAVVVRTSRKKSATIKVEEGIVSVVVPKTLPMDKIHQLVDSKHDWIIEKLAIYAEAQPPSEKEYVSGESFPYLGRNYRLKVLTGDLAPTKLINGRITVTVPDPDAQYHYIRRALLNWYKRNAEKKIREKVTRYAKQVGVETGVVRIKEFKSRWGSCTPYGDLEFNWLIVLAPNRIVDYVVVHELCHLIHHDHSIQFWKEVERVMPDYRECKEWLKDNVHKLVV
ncbi:M48 family metallopeptidase [Vibrio salinus]|uniref:M48 family metallopeptidase n=1 Tax=Vibrio salinus TaxID=2899784 RepID=UPI001E5EFACE|nr:SprT family zinc-dependent metalloprotease [Vibrio salinus]MCE0493117.1 M48 family metallopeptidase [Vibrio salinus]